MGRSFCVGVHSMKRLFSVVLILLLALLAFSPAKAATPQYSIQGIRYASADDELPASLWALQKAKKSPLPWSSGSFVAAVATSSLTAAITAIPSSRTSHLQNTFVPTRR